MLAAGCLLVEMLGDGEDTEEDGAERDARNGSQLLGEEIDNGGGKQQQRDQRQTDGDFGLADVKVAGHLPFTVFWFRKPQDQNGQGLEGKTPDHAECVQRRQQIDVAAAGDDREDLEESDEVDDAIAGSEPVMRFAEPCRHDAVFANAIEHAVGTDDGSVDGAGQDQHAHQHHESLEE